MTSLLTDRDLDLILQTVLRLTGIRFRSGQTKMIRETITRMMERVKITSAEQFARKIEQDERIYYELVEEITVGETYFFREPKHFEFVRTCVIPDLRSRRGDQTTLHAWSAACASGEEAYSLAIVCEETHHAASILATDISPEAIANAREATYRRWSFRGEAMSHVGPYVTPCGNDRLRLSRRIRKRVRFAQLNLASDVYPSGESRTLNLDLIFCRNVLIYFDAGTNAAIAERLFRCLAPGGWLITASGDPVLSEMADFVTTMTEYGTFYQRRLPSTPDTTAATLRPPSHVSPNPTSVRVSDHHGSPAIDPAAGSKAAADDLATRRQMTNEANKIAPPLTRPADSARKDADAYVIQIHALCRSDQQAALEACSVAVDQHPLSSELHFLHAKLLLAAGCPTEAFQAVQRALFLDRSAIMVHFLFGSIQHQRGQLDAARKHFRNARDLCRRLEPNEIIPYSDRATAAQIIANLDTCLAVLDR